MARSTVPAAFGPAAYLETSVDIGSVPANSTLDVDLNAPNQFQFGRLVKVEPSASLPAGLGLSAAKVLDVGGTKKIRFRVVNVTAAPIDPAAQTLRFVQLSNVFVRQGVDFP
jgi:hypothetical protein